MFMSPAFQAHHKIPYELLRDMPELREILDWAKKNGKEFNFNEIENGVMVQRKSLDLDVSGHANHPHYTDELRARILDLYKISKGDMAKAYKRLSNLLMEIDKKIMDDVIKGAKNIDDLTF